jgi:predicted nucleotidyltransferase
MDSSNLDAVRLVAVRFGTMVDDVVFLGGATVDLLVTDPGARAARPTRDVDVVIEVASRVEYHWRLRPQLLQRGFHEDETSANTCCWLVDDIKVDVMPTAASVLGFTNPWYGAAVATAVPYPLPDGPTIRLVSGPCFLATKLAAFRDRGKGDLLGSVDIEDIVAILDGRSEIEDEVAAAREDVRAYVAGELEVLVSEGALIDVLPGHLEGDSVHQARLPRLVARIQRLARL